MNEAEATTHDDLESALDEAAEAVAVQTSRIPALASSKLSGDQLGFESLLEVPVKVTVEIGRTRMTLGAVSSLVPGSLIELDRAAHEPCDILVNGKIVARGEIVTIGEQYGVRITSVQTG
jgi:flagellar motor switch protein FliN/FliY